MSISPVRSPSLLTLHEAPQEKRFFDKLPVHVFQDAEIREYVEDKGLRVSDETDGLSITVPLEWKCTLIKNCFYIINNKEGEVLGTLFYKHNDPSTALFDYMQDTFFVWKTLKDQLSNKNFTPYTDGPLAIMLSDSLPEITISNRIKKYFDPISGHSVYCLIEISNLLNAIKIFYHYEVFENCFKRLSIQQQLFLIEYLTILAYLTPEAIKCVNRCENYLINCLRDSSFAAKELIEYCDTIINTQDESIVEEMRSFYYRILLRIDPRNHGVIDRETAQKLLSTESDAWLIRYSESINNTVLSYQQKQYIHVAVTYKYQLEAALQERGLSTERYILPHLSCSTIVP